MAIKDILKMYSSPQSSTTEDGRMLALSLAEIQTELLALREQMEKNAPSPPELLPPSTLPPLNVLSPN